MKSVFAMAVPLISLVVFLQSCTYDKEMLVAVPASAPNSADTATVSFAVSIQPLLRVNCFSCHGNGSSLGDVSLDTYDDVRALAVSGRLLGSISHSAGFAPMPEGADKLDDSSIDAVRIWIGEGTRNN
jgi:mono/diheme cytochrome c family protein